MCGGILIEYEPLSNWDYFPVTYDNMAYPTLEHGFMHIKCVMNDDVTSARSILDSQEPYMAKQIGDKVNQQGHLRHQEERGSHVWATAVKIILRFQFNKRTTRNRK